MRAGYTLGAVRRPVPPPVHGGAEVVIFRSSRDDIVGCHRRLPPRNAPWKAACRPGTRDDAAAGAADHLSC
jgi:hypothetical protein